MNFTKTHMISGSAGVALTASMLLSGGANAAAVTFSMPDDSTNAGILDTRELWDVANSMQTSDTTYDIAVSDFKADGLGGLEVQALDTFSIKITAPTGFWITQVDYIESGTRDVAAGAIAVATGSTVVNGEANSLGLNYFPGPSSSTVPWTLTTSTMFAPADQITVADFAVTNSMFAFGDATIEKFGGTIEVTLQAVPIPPAAMLLLPALAGLVTVSRRAQSA